MTTVAAVVAAAVAVVVAVVAVGCFLSMTLTLNTDHSVTYFLARLFGRDSLNSDSDSDSTKLNTHPNWCVLISSISGCKG